MKFLDPTNDLAFKRIFGNENKKDILISFLNSLLDRKKDQEIVDVVLLNPYQAPQIKDARETILDVRCKDSQQREYIVEMQVLPQEYFDKPILYYASKAYVNQLQTDQTYNVLAPVIFLGILNFNFTESSHYLSSHYIAHVETKEHLFKDFEFVLAELPKFNKTETELHTTADKWLYFLKHAKELNTVPSVLKEQALKEAFKIIDRLRWNKEELEYYDRHAMAVQDKIQRVKFAYRQGRESGKKEGLKEGMEKSIQKGMEQGIAQEKLALAKKMLSKAYDLQTISDLTGLTMDEIKSLQ